MSITHIPANDWAAVGARLERCNLFSVQLQAGGTQWMATAVLPGQNYTAKAKAAYGKTPLEALTAALDAAEESK